MKIYKCYVCPECGSKRTRDLECELHGKNCPLIICCDCGSEVIDRREKQGKIKLAAEWQDIPELDAQIRTIKEPDPKDKDDIFWTVEIGLQESLGEQGGDIITEFYKEKPTVRDIKEDIINWYKAKKIEINKEVAIGIVAKSYRDEMIEKAIDKVFRRQTNLIGV